MKPEENREVRVPTPDAEQEKTPAMPEEADIRRILDDLRASLDRAPEPESVPKTEPEAEQACAEPEEAAVVAETVAETDTPIGNKSEESSPLAEVVDKAVSVAVTEDVPSAEPPVMPERHRAEESEVVTVTYERKDAVASDDSTPSPDKTAGAFFETREEPARAFGDYEDTDQTATLEERLSQLRRFQEEYAYSLASEEAPVPPAFKTPASVSEAADPADTVNRSEETAIETPSPETTVPDVDPLTLSPGSTETVKTEIAEDADETDVLIPVEVTKADRILGAETVSVPEFDAFRETLADDLLTVPEELETPEPFNEDDYMISDRTAGEEMAAGESTREYISHTQNEDISQGFRKRIRVETVKTVFLAFFTTALLVTENIQKLFGIVLPAFGDNLGIRGLPVLLNMQLLLLSAFFALPQLIRGVTALYKKKFLPETNGVILVFLAFIYDWILYLTDESQPLFFSFCAAVYLLFLLIFDLVKLNTDYLSFTVVSSTAPKTVAFTASLDDYREEKDSVSDMEIDGEALLSETRRAGFVEGFFTRVGSERNDGIHAILLLVSVLCGLTAFLVSYLVFDASLSESFRMFAVSVALILPLSATFVRRFPTAEVSKISVLRDSAVVGEFSALEYASTRVFVLRDTDLFPTRNVKVKGIKLFGDNRLDRVLCQVSALFHKIGGPLAEVFGSVGAGMPKIEDVTLRDVAETGIEARLDGNTLLVGDGAFMESHHVTLLYDSEDVRQNDGGKVSIMYVAENGQISARFYLQYVPSEEVEKVVEKMAKEKISVILRTFDPNLTNALVRRVSYLNESAVRVAKKRISALNEEKKPRLNSGIVTTAGVPTLIDTLFTVLSLRKLLKCDRLFLSLGAVFGIALLFLLLFTGHAAHLLSATVALYQIFWFLPLFIATKLCIRE